MKKPPFSGGFFLDVVLIEDTDGPRSRMIRQHTAAGHPLRSCTA